MGGGMPALTEGNNQFLRSGSQEVSLPVMTQVTNTYRDSPTIWCLYAFFTILTKWSNLIEISLAGQASELFTFTAFLTYFNYWVDRGTSRDQAPQPIRDTLQKENADHPTRPDKSFHWADNFSRLISSNGQRLLDQIYRSTLAVYRYSKASFQCSPEQKTNLIAQGLMISARVSWSCWQVVTGCVGFSILCREKRRLTTRNASLEAWLCWQNIR